MARRDAQEVLDDALCSDPPGGRLAARYLWIQIGVYGRPLRRFSRPGNGSATDPLRASLVTVSLSGPNRETWSSAVWRTLDPPEPPRPRFEPDRGS